MIQILDAVTDVHIGQGTGNRTGIQPLHRIRQDQFCHIGAMVFAVVIGSKSRTADALDRNAVDDFGNDHFFVTGENLIQHSVAGNRIQVRRQRSGVNDGIGKNLAGIAEIRGVHHAIDIVLAQGIRCCVEGDCVAGVFGRTFVALHRIGVPIDLEAFGCVIGIRGIQRTIVVQSHGVGNKNIGFCSADGHILMQRTFVADLIRSAAVYIHQHTFRIGIEGPGHALIYRSIGGRGKIFYKNCLL